MRRLVRSALATLSLTSLPLALPALAHAADGHVTANVSLRAGPAPDYPLIAVIPAGSDVNVHGCTEGWEWCDVIAYGNRGWVAGNYIEYEYRHRPVLLPAYGAQLGVPVVTFVIGTYWDSHYRSRPFYRERDHWYRHAVPHQPPPSPPRNPYRPPMHGAPGHDRHPGKPARPPISPRPMPGPIAPLPGVHPVPLKKNVPPPATRPSNQPAEPAAPPGTPEKGKPGTHDGKDDHQDR